MKKMFSLVVLSVLLISNVYAGNWSVGVKAGTPGLGISVARTLSRTFNLHVDTQYLNLKLNNVEANDYTYSATADFASYALLLDYFPFKSFFRLTGGVMLNLNTAETVMVPTKTYKIGGDEYTPEKLGNLSVDFKFKKVAPYIGFGFGNSTSGKPGFNITFDIGTMHQGVPMVELTAIGLLEPSAAPDQEQQIEQNINWFKWYPFAVFGFHYKF